MGTGKSGRYLNTQGSGRSVSDFALVHSNEGKYTKPSRKGSRLRLVSGGHGQKGMEQLDRYGIAYNIVKTYPNGVRVGNIPSHKKTKKQTGTGQAWFPKSWTENDIRRAGEHVAGLRSNRRVKDGRIIYGVYKGVRVGVMRTNGKIATVFPDSNQNIYLRRKKK
jgi:hypothetical protein